MAVFFVILLVAAIYVIGPLIATWVICGTLKISNGSAKFAIFVGCVMVAYWATEQERADWLARSQSLPGVAPQSAPAAPGQSPASRRFGA